MYTQNPRIKDAQNPYRTGVLVGNYTEDRFGRDSAAIHKQGNIGISENKANFHQGNSMRAYDMQPKTQEMILVSIHCSKFFNNQSQRSYTAASIVSHYETN